MALDILVNAPGRIWTPDLHLTHTKCVRRVPLYPNWATGANMTPTLRRCNNYANSIANLNVSKISQLVPWANYYNVLKSLKQMDTPNIATLS